MAALWKKQDFASSHNMVKTINEEVYIQALVDKKKVIITKTSVRSDIKMLKNLEGGVKFLMYPRFVKVFLDKQVEGMSRHKEIYVIPSHTKKVFANMKRQGKYFSSRDTPLFPTKIVQAQEQVEPVIDDIENVASVPTHSNDPLLSGGCIQTGEEIDEINQDAEVTLVDETQGSTADLVTTTGEVVTTANVVVSTAEVTTDSTTTTTVDELTLA
ncbi:hypothetical protein Tco_1183024 [Tanacetum coccineum]